MSDDSDSAFRKRSSPTVGAFVPAVYGILPGNVLLVCGAAK